ncbi:hypothetical protein MACK_000048 [Theileria orientalis]|uniref:Uncharacterized protein n=1 Tax=Theileria orientalis TaxID=68886 RepID=A0A976M979_THEOR|nr:hypothetical protein MACK_000048 [Theileria orientalis]
MKSVKCVRLFLLFYGITAFQPPFSCGTTGETQPSDQQESIDIDINNINSTKLEVKTTPDLPEIDIISPKENQIINTIKIGEHTLWKKLPTTQCLNLLKFRTKTDKIFITLNTLNSGEKFYINLVYDPTERADSGTSDAESIANKTKYIGIIPFLIKLNEEFGKNKESISEIEGTELNIDDIFDKWYFKYSSKTTNVNQSGKNDVFLYEIYEANEKETISEITNNIGKIWPKLEEEENNKKVLQKVEVYSKNGKRSALEMTMTDVSKIYLFWEAGKNTYGKVEEEEFKKKLNEAEFRDPMKQIESGSQRVLTGNTIEALNIESINKENFNFVKHKLSTVRVVTVVPKEKKRVKELRFNERQTYSMDSDNYTIDIIKWKEDKYATETIIKHEDENYNCHYTEQRKNDTKMYYVDQEVFYNSIKMMIEKNESKYITYTPFKFFYRPDERVEGSETESEVIKRRPQTETVESNENEVTSGSEGQKSEQDQKERTSAQTITVNRESTTTDKSKDASTVASGQGSRLPTQSIETSEKNTSGESVGEDSGKKGTTELTDDSEDLMNLGEMEEIEDFDEPMTLGENIIAKAEELLQKIEDIHSRVKTRVDEDKKSNEGTNGINIDEIEENCLRDSIQFLKFIKSKLKKPESETTPKEPSQTVDKVTTGETTKSGFMTKGVAVTLMMLATIII